MKIFDKVEAWPSKVNFVDKNNVVVGYDMSQCCCEDANWCLKRNLNGDMHGISPEHIPGLDDYVFDCKYFNDNHCPKEYFDEGGAVAFRLTNGTDDLYLILYNSHNGYYSHGFTVEVAGITTRVGDL